MFFKCAKAPVQSVLPRRTIESYVEHGLIKSAAMQEIAMRPDHWYLDVWAVSGYEKFGLNENADGFEIDELRRSFPTFIGSWACLNHENYREDLSVGRNMDAVLTPDDYVRIVMGVNRVKAEKRHPGLEGKVASGNITDTSMGCLCRESVCAIPKCANVATDETQFCDHVRTYRGQILCNADTDWKPIKCGELNRGVIFFEDSIITNSEGADNNAKILAKLAVREGMIGPKSIPADKLYMVLRKLANSGSATERAVIAHVLEHLSAEL